MAIINRLRFVDIMSPGLGGEESREFAEALQDEMQDVVLSSELQLIADRFQSQIDVRLAEMEVRLQRFILGALGIGLTALGIVTAILLTQG
ncbi:MAG: hypothetical protein OXS30_12010 [Chloroflexota bacterium]|nr:hypothetical protein [Chloroflexota bacterium]